MLVFPAMMGHYLTEIYEIGLLIPEVPVEEICCKFAKFIIIHFTISQTMACAFLNVKSGLSSGFF